ncbi:SGNH hydrolase [Phycomyces nitens]|nr:SGNH hydrolase [Phycomyces nitens]
MNHPYHKIILFGDSITQFSFDPYLCGFGANIANVYQRKCDVLNRGLSGYNTNWALPVLPQLLPTVKEQEQLAKVHLLVIFFGANDATIPGSFQHVPLPKYKKNLEDMLSLVQSPSSPYYNPSLRVILVTPPPVNVPQWRKHRENEGGGNERTLESTATYAECVKSVTKAHNVPAIDIWSEIMDRTKREGRDLSEFLIDGLHFTSLGNEVMFNAIMKTIKTTYPEIDPDVLEMELPGFQDVNPNDYENSLQFKLIQKK